MADAEETGEAQRIRQSWSPCELPDAETHLAWQPEARARLVPCGPLQRPA
jgi:hypothetical protein